MAAKKTVLGSGYVYLVKYDSETGIPADAEIETEGHLYGYIKGGAQLEYKPTTYDVEDDNGDVEDGYVTKEEISLKYAIITWDLAKLNQFVSTGKCTVDTTTKAGKTITTLKIGGASNQNDDRYIVRFKHATRNLRVTLLGNNQSGLSLDFQPDKETAVNGEIKGKKMDSSGTLIIITTEEDTPTP